MWIARIGTHQYAFHKIYRFHGVIGGVGWAYWPQATPPFSNPCISQYGGWQLHIWVEIFFQMWIARIELHQYTFHKIYGFHVVIGGWGKSIGPKPFFASKTHVFPNMETASYT